jgi:hypothetical protein
MTKNHGLAVAAHFQDGAGTISHLFSILMVANTSAKDNDILMSIFL